MSLLLDTPVTSELRRARRPGADRAFANWAATTDLSRAFVSVVTIHEMERGVLLTERKDPAQGAAYRAWLEDLLEAFDGRVLGLSLGAARLAASFHVPDPAPLADALIAGTAAERGLAVVTRNTHDFGRFGVALVNPWDPTGGTATRVTGRTGRSAATGPGKP
ncbi:MAG: type II toxin-antitoxin system VapC family toxin [Bifidobacteriaceae bacterium]|jgi:predicted nucleic acid-binding protein|nr:type II toxin-antitoxin system VapC family toxin [Bifidobacteriaceae bacterium]